MRRCIKGFEVLFKGERFRAWGLPFLRLPVLNFYTTCRGGQYSTSAERGGRRRIESIRPD